MVKSSQNGFMEERRVDREIQGELKFGEKLTAVQGIIEWLSAVRGINGTIAGGRAAICGSRN